VLTAVHHDVELRLVDDGFTDVPYVYRHAAKGGWYERPFLEHIRSLELRGVYVDVGAHLGTHTLWFARLCPSTHVHAIEPVARFAGVLRANLAANGVDDKVTVHEVGVAGSSGTATNFLSRHHQAGFDGPLETVSGVDVTFPVQPLDALVRGRVVVVKIDVEGMEADVIAGAHKLLMKHRPVVYAEANDDTRAKATLDALAPLGYEPTGRVFNHSPTYEYTVPRRRRGR
jgi:FkbM family methyltransferase